MTYIQRRAPLARRRGKAGKRTSKRRKARKAGMRDADRLFSEFIKTRDDWTCRACWSVKVIQCAHLVSRRYRATRWSADNAVALCSRCHMRWTYNPLAWEEWCEEQFPGRLFELKRRALAGVAWVDYEAVMESLRLQMLELHQRRDS